MQLSSPSTRDLLGERELAPVGQVQPPVGVQGLQVHLNQLGAVFEIALAISLLKCQTANMYIVVCRAFHSGRML